MRRVLAFAGFLLAAGGVAPVAAHAVSASPAVTCGHLQLSFQMTAPVVTDTAYPFTVAGSTCSVGSSASTAVTGSGTVTFLGLQDNSACGGLVVCERYALNLSNGAALGFTALGATYFQFVGTGIDLSQSVLDHGNAETITNFASGAGAGALNTVCTYASPTFTCRADGGFVWEPGL